MAELESKLEQMRRMKEQSLLSIERLEERKAQITDRRDRIYPAYEKELLDRYLMYKGNIRVFIRVRPVLENDFKAYSGSRDSFDLYQSQIKMPNAQQVELDMTGVQQASTTHH